MKILIIGASGFIGTNLLNSLLKNKNNIILCTSRNKISEIDKYGVRYENYSLGEDFNDEIIKFSPEVIINLAWQGIPDFRYKNSVININNHMLFINKINQLKTVKKLIYAGSCAELEEKETNLKFSKNIIHNYLKLSQSEHNIEIYWLQIFYVYGFGQRSESIIPTLVNNYINNKPLNIKNPDSECDFIHINDVIDVIESCMNNVLEPGDYQVGSGKTINILVLSEIIRSIIFNNNQIYISSNIQKNKLNNKVICADIKKINDKIKKFPRVEIEHGIRKFISTYEK